MKMEYSKNPDTPGLRPVVILAATVFLTAASAFSQESIDEASSEDPNYITLSGTLLFNGRPLAELENGKLSVSYNSESTGRKKPQIITSYDSKIAKYEIRNLPRSNVTLFFGYYKMNPAATDHDKKICRAGNCCSRDTERTLPENYKRIVPVDISRLNNSELS